jgi:hypothetical protein
MPLMASALLGNRSIISSELYCYVFLHANVSYVNSLLPSRSDLSNEQNKPTSSVEDNNEYAQSCLDAVMAAVSKDDEHNEFCGGTTSYKTADGTVVFLTQAKSYYHRDPAFANYSHLEFECIIQLQDKTSSAKNLTTVKAKAINPGPVPTWIRSSTVSIPCGCHSHEDVHTNSSRGSSSQISWESTNQR